MSSQFNETMPRVIPGPGAAKTSDRSLGAMLVDAGAITPEDAERILRYSKEHSTRFGDAALALKLAKPEDIQQALARQFDYPYLVPGQSGVSADVVAAWSPFSRQVEALRALRSQLLLRWFADPLERRTLAIVSPNRGDGRSFLAANLAVVFSQMGERTLLVDCDLRNPRQHELFGVKNSVGLSTLLSERAGLDAAQRVPAFVDLSVLPAGPIPPNPLELLGRETFSRTMKEIASAFEVVILDTPAADIGSDFQLVSARSSGALLVARKDVSRADDCSEVAGAIKATSAQLVGAVLNER